MKGLKIFLLFLVLFGVFWTFFIIEPRGANDFPYAFSELVKAGFNLPQTWSRSGFGEYVASILWAWPVDVLYGLGATLNIDFSILERVIGIIPAILVGFFGIGKLLEFYQIKGWGNFVGVLIYLLNTYFLLLIDGGQLVIALSYAFLPFAFLLFEKSINGKFKDRLSAGCAVSLLGFFDIRFIYVLGILLLLRFLYEFIFISKSKWPSLVFEWVKTGIVAGAIFLGLNIYWLIPLFLTKAPILPEAYTKISQTSFLSFANLGHAMFLLAPHWYKNVFGKITPLLPFFVFLPILAFLAPSLRRKDKNVGFWLLVAVISIFLVKGANPPFTNIYEWLFIHVPGFSLFRDPTKFFVLISISYSFLIGITVYEISKKLKAFPILIAAYLVLLVNPVYLGKMTGLFSKPIYQAEYFKLANILESDKAFGRILWLPSRPPLGFASLAHPSTDALTLSEKKPYSLLITGSYELLNYLRNPFIPQILDISGIGYISYPFPDTRREDLKPDNIHYYYWFLDKFESYSWLTPIIKDGNVPLLKVNNHQDKFFIPTNLFWVNDSSAIYQELLKFSNFRLANNAFVFVNDNPEAINRINDFPSSLVWDELSQKDKTRLVSSKNTAKVTYQKISPTQYRVKVEGLTKPSVLAFSESYNPLWTANGKSSIPLYGLINGFPIDKDGTYDIYFTPQRYVVPGLLVSGTTLLILVLGLFILK